MYTSPSLAFTADLWRFQSLRLYWKFTSPESSGLSMYEILQPPMLDTKLAMSCSSSPLTSLPGKHAINRQACSDSSILDATACKFVVLIIVYYDNNCAKTWVTSLKGRSKTTFPNPKRITISVLCNLHTV